MDCEMLKAFSIYFSIQNSAFSIVQTAANRDSSHNKKNAGITATANTIPIQTKTKR
jgi:hypothetical protein